MMPKLQLNVSEANCIPNVKELNHGRGDNELAELIEKAENPNEDSESENRLMITIETLRENRKKQSAKINYQDLNIRTALVITMIFGFVILSKYNHLIKSSILYVQTKTLMFCLSEKISHFLFHHTGIRHSFLIFASLSVDFIAFFSLATFILFSSTWDYIKALILYGSLIIIFDNVYSSSQIQQNNLFWEYPGVPSLIISYEKYDSYLYGSLGFTLISIVHLRRLGIKSQVIYFCLISLSCQSIILIVFGQLYLIDILIALIISMFCARILFSEQ